MGNKKIINYIEKIEDFLKELAEYRYNEVTNIVEYKKKDKQEYEPITDYIENSILRDMLKNGLKCTINQLRNIICSDFTPKYDPFKEYLNSLPEWDGQTDYIQMLADTVKTTNQEFWRYCFKKYLVASVGSLIEPQVINHVCPILCGKQGLGKTSWLIKLCPPSLKRYLYIGAIQTNNKDTMIHLSECWYIIIDEFGTMTRSETNQTNEILTKSIIRQRNPYCRNQETMQRRASCAASVNDMQFLKDMNGSRRYPSFLAEEINYNHNINLNLVYSQALALFRQGFKFYFDNEDIERINQQNEAFQINTPEEELLMKYYEPISKNEAVTYLTATDILVRLRSLSGMNFNDGSAMKLGKALKKCGFERMKKGGIYVWAVKTMSNEN